MNNILFLHGLDSSSQGTKACWFSRKYPDMIIPDFTGELQERMKVLEKLVGEQDNLILIGSSFGGLMASLYAMAHPTKCKKIILLAPALNFPGFKKPGDKIDVPTSLFIGKHDKVTPPDLVIPLAKESFSNLQICLGEDDHLLRDLFSKIDWNKELML